MLQHKCRRTAACCSRVVFSNVKTGKSSFHLVSLTCKRVPSSLDLMRVLLCVPNNTNRKQRGFGCQCTGHMPHTASLSSFVISTLQHARVRHPMHAIHSAIHSASCPEMHTASWWSLHATVTACVDSRTSEALLPTVAVTCRSRRRPQIRCRMQMFILWLGSKLPQRLC